MQKILNVLTPLLLAWGVMSCTAAKQLADYAQRVNSNVEKVATRIAKDTLYYTETVEVVDTFHRKVFVDDTIRATVLADDVAGGFWKGSEGQAYKILNSDPVPLDGLAFVDDKPRVKITAIAKVPAKNVPDTVVITKTITKTVKVPAEVPGDENCTDCEPGAHRNKGFLWVIVAMIGVLASRFDIKWLSDIANKLQQKKGTN